MSFPFSLDEVSAALLGGAVIASALHWWVNRKFGRPITIDDVFKNPHDFFHNSEWDSKVSLLVAVAAYERALEEHGDRVTDADIAYQEKLYWQLLNHRLLQGDKNA